MSPNTHLVDFADKDKHMIQDRYGIPTCFICLNANSLDVLVPCNDYFDVTDTCRYLEVGFEIRKAITENFSEFVQVHELLEKCWNMKSFQRHLKLIENVNFSSKIYQTP